MKPSELKSFIKEAVREAIKEELREILTEAVTPAKTTSYGAKPPVVEKAVKTDVTPTQKKSGDPIMEMLNMTQQSMTRDDFRNVMQSQMQSGMNEVSLNSNNIPAHLPAGPQPGLDISKLDFVKNAAAVYNRAKEKDNFKVGG